MSNKIVPAIYRAVIDDVISNIKSEFDEFGVSEDVLAELQRKWETKVIASHVAEFESQPPTAPAPTTAHVAQQQPQQQQHHPAYAHPMHMLPHYPTHNPYAPMVAANQGAVKSEPIDNRYMLNPSAYALPPLPGPSITNSRTLPPPVPHHTGVTSVLSFGRPGMPTAVSMPAASGSRPAYTLPQPAAGGQPQRIPQVDGPASDSEDDESPSPPASYAPRSTHPSLAQPSAPKAAVNDSEAINSDLDDSDTGSDDEQEEGAGGENDIVFCTYDKVARVKNKWKCILKDGMIHINGKDYLFAKCTGEFEW